MWKKKHFDTNHYENDPIDNDKPESEDTDDDTPQQQQQQQPIKEPSERDPHNYLAKPNHINDMNKSFRNNFVMPDTDDMNENEMIDRPNEINDVKESAKDFKVCLDLHAIGHF